MFVCVCHVQSFSRFIKKEYAFCPLRPSGQTFWTSQVSATGWTLAERDWNVCEKMYEQDMNNLTTTKLETRFLGADVKLPFRVHILRILPLNVWRRGPWATLKVSGISQRLPASARGIVLSTWWRFTILTLILTGLQASPRRAQKSFTFCDPVFLSLFLGGLDLNVESWWCVFFIFFRRWASRYGTVLTRRWRLDFGIHFEIHRIFTRAFACSRTEWFGWWASRTIGRRLPSSFLFLLQLVMMNYANDHPAMQRWC